MYSKINKKNIYILIFFFLFSFITVGYAYLNSLLNINGTVKLNKSTWDVHFENIVKVDGSVDAINDAVIVNDTSIDFIVDFKNLGDFYSFTVDVVNDGTIDAMLYSILNVDLKAEQKEYVDYQVTYFDGSSVLEKDSLPSGMRDTLLVLVKYRDDILSSNLPSDDQGITFNLSTEYVQADDSSNDRRPVMYLLDEIMEQNKENGVMVLDNKSSKYVSSSTGINFDVAPSNTNGKGVYVRNGTENDKYPIYYYRGEVDNNNVIFADFCWKIVRTTETGGIKLIYNGIPSLGTCNNTGEKSQLSTKEKFNLERNYNAYLGYMYGIPNSLTFELEHENTNNSSVKDKIDEWYSSTMTSYTKYLEDTVWCNDRSFASNNTGTGLGGSNTNYASYERNIVGANPSLVCINKNDRFTVNEIMEGRLNGNGALTYPVSLLTADELTLAGQGNKGYSTNNYLYTSQFFWSLSPGYFSNNYAYPIYVDSNGSLVSTYSVSANARGIRPSISLKKDSVVKIDGDGSENSPYIVV